MEPSRYFKQKQVAGSASEEKQIWVDWELMITLFETMEKHLKAHLKAQLTWQEILSGIIALMLCTAPALPV